ncbi:MULTISPECIES: hypothetical protein [Bacillus cereus group]|uniref:hypothetical protein n=1 Tax=Bacillus cereus group TaxID=86661 RepID=UPI0010152F72|nr:MULTISPECIES: hypothetical protein [Bacillus cereus group]MCU5201647.1 hypothetical protein [Bacillus paranthracis]MCU5374673.1 hypothetical protein [Bacillus pacificus]GCF76352.1 hypothetical protein BC2926_38930 [Bacillus cereus]
MVERDLNIIKDLIRFRCMSRDQILKLHFGGNKNKISNGNNVLKRLVDRNYITVNKEYRPFIYFPNPPTIKIDSSKLLHFLEIVNLYISLRGVEELTNFVVEPKFKKGFVEPDFFCIFKKIPIFFEIQLSLYSRSAMENKLNSYKELYESDIIKNESWQQLNKIIYPPIVLISHHRYDVSVTGLKVLQYQSIQQFIDHVNKKSITKNKSVIV